MGEKQKKKPSLERRTPEGLESYLINLAMKQACKMLENGTAPAQIVSHFLKLGTENAKFEREKLKAETKLAMSKANIIESQQRYEEIASEALEAFKKYSGFAEDDESDEDYDDEY